jgi:hypothetical protein
VGLSANPVVQIFAGGFDELFEGFTLIGNIIFSQSEALVAMSQTTIPCRRDRMFWSGSAPITLPSEPDTW